MKYPCGLIRDILPLYIDEVCSAESREAAEEHLSECKDCAEYYKALSDDSETVPIPEIEDHKADSYRAVRRRIKHGRWIVIGISALLLVACLSLCAVLTMPIRKRIIEYNGSNITVTMRAEGLVAAVKGTRYSSARCKSVFTESGGEKMFLKIFYLEESERDAFLTGENDVFDFTVAYADRDAGRVDAVYYCGGGELAGMEELPPEELAEALGKMDLLWEK